MDRAGTVAALVGLFCLGGPGENAQAHRVQYPKMDALSISPRSVTLQIEYLIPSAEESGLLYRLFDRDHSGGLDASEQQALREYLCQQAGAFVRLELDGRPLALARTHAALGRVGAGELLAVSLTLEAAMPMAPGAHALRLFDRHKDRAQAVPVRVATQGVRLTTQRLPLPLLAAEQPLQLEFARLD